MELILETCHVRDVTLLLVDNSFRSEREPSSLWKNQFILIYECPRIIRIRPCYRKNGDRDRGVDALRMALPGKEIWILERNLKNQETKDQQSTCTNPES